MTRDAVVDITIAVNGTIRRLQRVPADLALLDLLNDELGLTGTKFGCGMGICRACTVAVRPRPDARLEAARACSLMAAALDGYAITTVEGLAPPGEIAPLQQAFLDAFAFQCGYCAPGFLMAAFVLIDRLKRSPVAKADVEAEIAGACGSHVCRCTGYRRYYDAIRNAVLMQPGLTI